MDKNQIIKRAELLPAYCEATGYFPDECVGASEEELRAELVSFGFQVEELPAKVQAEPWVAPVVTDEARAMAPGFWA